LDIGQHLRKRVCFVLNQGLVHAANIDDFICFGCNLSIGAVEGDEVGTHLKASKGLDVVDGDVASFV
jgi:hypothetical protein